MKLTRPSRQRRQSEDEETVEAVTDSTVSDAAACCLADIDEVLNEQDAELTDEQIVAQGDPQWVEPQREDYFTYDEYLSAWDRSREDNFANRERFDQAYERLTGMSYQRHRCCGSCCK